MSVAIFCFLFLALGLHCTGAMSRQRDHKPVSKKDPDYLGWKMWAAERLLASSSRGPCKLFQCNLQYNWTHDLEQNEEVLYIKSTVDFDETLLDIRISGHVTLTHGVRESEMKLTGLNLARLQVTNIELWESFFSNWRFDRSERDGNRCLLFFPELFNAEWAKFAMLCGDAFDLSRFKIIAQPHYSIDQVSPPSLLVLRSGSVVLEC